MPGGFAVKKAGAVLLPVLSVVIIGILVLLGFRIGSQPRHAVMEPEIQPDQQVSETSELILPELECPPWAEADSWLLSYHLPGYTMLKANDLYGDAQDMDVYGLYPGNELTQEAIWTDDALLEVYLYAEPAEEGEARMLTSAAVTIEPLGCGETKYLQMVKAAQDILSFLAPGVTEGARDQLMDTQAYRDLITCAMRYAGENPEPVAGTSVNETFAAGESGSVTLLSHEAYGYIEICLRVGSD